MRQRLEQWLAEDETRLLEQAGKLAHEAGMRLYLAGGSVRDILLGCPHQDWDLVVEGDGLSLAEALGEAWGGKSILHDRFLTARIELDGETHFDIATARTETYPRPGALPVVTPASMAEDLWRRDFAANALAVALGPDDWGDVLDPTGGIEDLRRRLIRALHDRSFWDDATRIVRAVGFEQRLGFSIERHTEAWIREAAAHGALQTVSTERLGEAILPLLSNSVGPQVLARGHELGIARALGVRVAFSRRALRALREVPAALKALGEAADPRARAVACLVALLLGRNVEAVQVIERLHLDRFTARELRGAERALRTWPEGFRPEARPGDLWAQLREADFGAVTMLWLANPSPTVRKALVTFWRDLRPTKPDFDLDDLRALGFRPGVLFGEAVQAALRAKLNDRAGRDGQLAVAREVLQGPEPS